MIDVIVIVGITLGLLYYMFKLGMFSKKSVTIKKKRYFTKPNEIGVVYVEDENGIITKFDDGQHY